MDSETLLKIINAAFMLAQAGFNKDIVTAAINAKIDAGATPDQVAEMLHDGRIQSELEAQAAIDAKP